MQISTDHLIDPDETEEAGDAAMPAFAPISAMQAAGGKQFRRVLVPAHRYTPLRDQWMDIYTPVVEQMLLQIRFNPKRRCVELKVRWVHGRECICVCMLCLSLCVFFYEFFYYDHDVFFTWFNI